jgi:TRAP-type C4-dicarboxylate transport system permease small subunit
MGPWLCGGLIALRTSPILSYMQQNARLNSRTVGTGIVAMFFPYNRTFDLVMAGGGCLIFSGYIVYDTYMITTRLSPDEFIMGAISLYLEYVLFFSVVGSVLMCVCFLCFCSFINLCMCSFLSVCR